jgi:hypothetical protein
MGKIIRCLFGYPSKKCYWSKRDREQTIRLKSEIDASLKYEWARKDVIHYVMGKDNEKLLKDYGAEKVIMVDERETVVPNEGICPLYNKVYLVNEAMKQHDEILFLDFDSLPVRGKNPDQKMWKILRSKKGEFNGSFQAPLVNRKRPFCLQKSTGGFRDPKKIFVRKTITTCVFYCNERQFIQEWLDHFLLYQEVVSKYGYSVLDKHDEYILMYYIDKEKGVMNEEEIVNNFEPEIVEVKNSYVRERDVDLIYFKHN